MALTRPEVNPSSAVPIYRQIADHIAGQVKRGELTPGDKLPASRELAEEWGVAYSTVSRAMAHLSEAGVVDVTVGKGTFIAHPRP